jgi:hypothetical protein
VFFTGKHDNNTWEHVALSLDRDTNLLRMYRNGSRPVVASAATVGSISNALALQFCSTFGLSPTFRGAHNDWIWRKGAPFTWDEIEAHYYDGVIPANPGGAVKQIAWGMREGSGTTIASSPAGYNGTLSSASWTTSTRSKKRAAA